MNNDSIQKYPLSMIAFHGLVAAAMIGTLVLGWLLDDFEGLIALHKSLGLSVLLLAVLRIANRLRHRTLPPSVNAAGSLQYIAEKSVHGLLYLSSIAVPLLGWLKSNAAGRAASFFGLFDLPTLIGKDRDLSHLLGEIHSAAATLFALLLAAHVLGALAHLVLHKQNVFKRVAP